jgi:hypothetical protein
MLTPKYLNKLVRQGKKIYSRNGSITQQSNNKILFNENNKQTFGRCLVLHTKLSYWD